MAEAVVADSIARQIEMFELFSSLQMRQLRVVDMAIGEIKLGKYRPVLARQRVAR
jgi:hypothetical protein